MRHRPSQNTLKRTDDPKQLQAMIKYYAGPAQTRPVRRKLEKMRAHLARLVKPESLRPEVEAQP